MKKQIPISVVAAVIERNGMVLIAKRRQGDILAGKWEFPGSKIDLVNICIDCHSILACKT